MIDIPDIYRDDLYSYFKNIAENLNYECYKDLADNIIIHKKGRGNSIIIPFIIDREELLITSVKGKKAEFISNLDIKFENNTDVYINDCLIGKIKKEEDKYISLLEDNSIDKGVKAYIKHQTDCKANKLYRINLKADISIFLAKNIILESEYSVKDIYFTLSFSKKAAKVIARSLEFESAFLISYDKADEKFKLSGGAGVAFKDNGVVIENNITNLYLSSETPHQNYFGKPDSLTEYFYISNKDAKVGSLVIPVKNINESCEIISLNDIDNTIQLYKNVMTKEV